MYVSMHLFLVENGSIFFRENLYPIVFWTRMLKEKKVIKKIFLYILTTDYSKSKTSKKKTNNLKLSRQSVLEIRLSSMIRYL